ncbi:MAG: nucleotidyltransferase family protein [Nitrosopumilaceae archaeon]|nr:nucleotidyltransferase family protein [Nitrosopumilaceae archaeon]
MAIIILAGGKGSRLNSITEYVPKSLIPINNKPIIEWQINHFKKFKCDKFIISLGYLADQVINYLQHKNNFGCNIECIIEECPLGTGGAIKQAIAKQKEQSHIIINGDIITDMDISILQSQLNTIAIIPLRTKYGVVNVNNEKITCFDEKKEILDKWMNAGVYNLSQKLLELLPEKGNIENTLFPIWAKQNLLHVIKYNDIFWHSIDSYKDIEECENKLNNVDLKYF